MNKTLIIPKQIVCADEQKNIFQNKAVLVNGNIIADIRYYSDDEIKKFNGNVVHAEGLTLIPGFIQTHLHLCQTLFRGMADDLQLLDWLQQKIFPYENSHNKNSLRISTQLGLNELLRGGTTTILDMGTLRYQEVIFEELIDSGIRAFAGKCMMDTNDIFPNFKAATKDELNYTHELAEAFHNSPDGRIRYGFAPRFVLSSSEGLLVETKQMMKSFTGSIYHTHSSENKNECAEVKRLHHKDNIEYFDSINVLDDHTVLAHCVHLNENEVDILKQRNTRVSHCPSSNLKLGSGIADIPLYIDEGISVSLGADGAPCNNSLSAFHEMKLASLIQKPLHGPTAMDAETIFRLATIEGARALHIENETGSIEVGKKADLVLLNLESPFLSLLDHGENVYSTIVYSASRENVADVMVDGKWIIRNGESLIYDEKELYSKGQTELTQLLNRVK